MSKDPAPPHHSRENLPAPEDPDRVLSLEDGPEIEITVKGSRFIAQAWRADDDVEALGRVESIRRRFHDASHHCWGFRSLQVSDAPGAPREMLIERWDDDGEPSGTAGLPIVGALRHSGINHAIVVVTRYFGGVKLGTGGLARAYGEAAREALRLAPPREIWKLVELRVIGTYDVLGVVEAFLTKNAESIRSVRRDFTDRPEFLLSVLKSRAGEFRASLVDATAGRVTILP